MPFETFVNPNHGLDREAIGERNMEKYFPMEPLRAQSTDSWPSIHNAICRNGLFVIEARTPSFDVMLRFNPNQFDEGDYMIHRKGHGGKEHGKILKVIVVEANETDEKRVSMLIPFATRYVVHSKGIARPFAMTTWLVGLNEYRTVNEDDVTDDD